MRRLKDEFVGTVDELVHLDGKLVLEIGCGTGNRSKLIAQKSGEVTAIDPNEELIRTARKENPATNIQYEVGSAEKLEFSDDLFAVTIFTLSLHHVPVARMHDAIAEARRVTRVGGHVVFLEPAYRGSFFDAELQFDACDGDERLMKAYAYYSMLAAKGLREVYEKYDETILQFDSLEDFSDTMHPQRNIPDLEKFLESHAFTLNAQRRINIFEVVE